jgi:putative intracellular protease/amidase
MHGLNNAQLPLTVGILVFDQVEVLDVAGPFEVFTVTRLNKEFETGRIFTI